MKKKSIQIAFGSSVLTLLLVVFFACANLELQKENNEALSMYSFTSVQDTEQEHIAYKDTPMKKVVDGDAFPLVGDREQEIEESTTIERGVYCPFTPEENQYVIDFTNNGTTGGSELVLYADREREDAVRTLETVSIERGVYSVFLASLAMEEDSTDSDLKLQQQWYLELYDQMGDVLSATGKTRDIQDNEVQSVELVEHAMTLREDALSAKAIHGAYKDTEEQKIIPLCALLTATEKQSANDQEITLLSSDNHLFTAVTLLQYTSELPKSQHSLYTVVVLLSLLLAVSAISLFSVLDKK